MKCIPSTIIQYNGGTNSTDIGGFWTKRCPPGIVTLRLRSGRLLSGSGDTTIYAADIVRCGGAGTVQVDSNDYFTQTLNGFTYNLSFRNDRSALLWTGVNAVGDFTQFSAMAFNMRTNMGLSWRQGAGCCPHGIVTAGSNSQLWTHTPGAITTAIIGTNSGLFDLGMVSDGTDLYLVGGLVLSSPLSFNVTAAIYNIETNSWSRTTAGLNVPHANLGVAILNGIIYAIGGENDGLNAINAVESYDIASPPSPTWTTLTSMNTARVNLGVSVLSGQIYAIAGGNTIIPGSGLSSVEAYNPSLNTWTTLGSTLNTARSYVSAVTLGGRIYVIGGLDTGPSALATCEVYDPDTDSWSFIASLNSPRYDGYATVLGGLIYIVGGTSNGTDFLATTEVYNPVTNTWTLLNVELGGLGGVRGLGVASSLGRIYAIGGRQGTPAPGISTITPQYWTA